MHPKLQNSADSVFHRFRASMAEFSLPRADRHMLVAFSGGADSTALLHLTHTLAFAQKHPPFITALHVNHGIRGDEAQRDAEFCRRFCEERNIPFVLYEADAPAQAKQRALSLEEAAREVRYECITAYLREHPDICCVLTAHHADDQTETVLFRLLRGTSLRGLCGIPKTRMLTVTDDSVPEGFRQVPIYRPLLSFSKEMLNDYLSINRIAHVTDSTNAENDASRNLLRNTVIPAAKTVNPAFCHALRRLSETAAEDDAYFSSLTDAFFRDLGIKPTDPIPTDSLTGEHPAVLRRILAAVYDAHRSVDNRLKPLTAEMLCAMIHAVKTASRTELSAGWCFCSSDSRCRMQRIAEQPDSTDYCLPLLPGEITDIPTGGSCLLCDGSVKSSENLAYLKNIYNFFISTHINSDKLLEDLYLRPRCDNQTDRYLCGGSHKTAKDALSAHRVPTHLRKIVPLFCDGDGIVWIPFCGIRDSVNPKAAEPGAPIFDLYYFYNSEV